MTKADETVAILDNSLSGALHYFDDEFHRYLETGASTFDLSIAKKHMMYSNASTGSEDDFQYLKENHFLVFTYKNRDYKFTIRRVEETESSLRLFCEDLSFDLLNEYRGPYKADKAYHISKYVNDCLVDSGYEIGINEFTKNERTLEWEGDQTVLKRLLSICNSFEAEIEFETILNDDRTVDKQLVHLRKRVGMDRPDVELKYGRDVSSIRRNVDLTELITGIKPRGHEEDNKVVTIKNVEKEIKDEDGNIVFYTKKGSEYIYAPMANQEYGNPERKGGGYIVDQFSYDTKSDTELFNRALTELKKKCGPAYEFEIEGFYDIDIGDTIRAIDEGYNPILLLEARISEQTISFSDPTKNKTVYSNYRILQNKVSQSLLDRIDEVKKYAEQVAKTYIFSISNVGSPMFKNGEGEVIFTAKIEKNNQDMTGEFTSYNWVKQNKDGSLDTIWNAAHQGIGKSITVKPEDFEDTATFSYEALQDDLVVGGASGVVTKVFDGENGKTPVKGIDYFDGEPGTNGLSAYLHIRYSQNSNGNPMTSDPTGAKYIGVQASQNPNPSTVPADYMWAEFKGQDGIPGETGADGKTSYLHIKYSNDGGQTFTGNGGEDVGTWMGQYVDFTQADSTDVKKYAWSKIKGEDGKKGDKGDPGNQGIPGEPGENGKTPYAHYAYAWSADGTDRFTDTYPNENLFSKETATNLVINAGGTFGNSVHGVITGCFFRVRAGEEYTLNDFNTVHDRYRAGISVNIPAPNENFTWIHTNQQQLNKPTSVTIPSDGYLIVQLATSSTGLPPNSKIKIEHGNQPTIYTPAPSDDFENAYPTYSGTYTDYTAQDSQNPADYTWTRILGESGQDGKDGVAGKDGVGIKSTTVTYALSDSGTTAPTSGWMPTVPTLIKGKYLWTKSVWTYTDASTETGYSVTYVAKDGNDGQDGIAGKDGVGIKSTAITYAVSSSGTTAPSSGWVTNPPAATAGQFMWTRTVWTYTDNSTETGYSVGKIGNNGSQGPAGNGIASTAITYQASASGTTAPTGTWSTTIPSVPAGQFLWTKTVTTYTNNTNSTAYTVAKMGSDGKPGSAGISVSSVVEEYYVSTSPTSQAGGSWSTTVPNNADPNKYIWRRLKTTMSNGTVTYTNPALIQGMTGIYPYIGPTQPANPKEGQQWWKSDASGNVTNFYVYKSGSWQGQTIQQSVLNIIELNAVRILGSTITGTTINTSILNNSGTYQDSGATIIYNSTYNGNITADWAVENSTQNGTFILSPRNLAAISYTDAARKNPGWHWVIDNNGIDVGNPSYSAIYGGEGITIYNTQLSPTYGRVKLEFQDLMTMPATLIPASSGFSQYATSGDNAPLVSRQGRVVQLSGAFKNNAVLESGASGTMGTLPAWARPERAVLMRVQASYNNTYLLTINTNGTITMSRHAAGENNVSVPAGSWLNIAIVYAAANL